MAKDPFDDEPSTQERMAAAARKDAADRQFMLDLQTTLKADGGCRVLWHIVDMCNPFDNAFDTSSKQAYNLGRQHVGQEIMRLIGEADPRALGQMVAQQYATKLKESQS